MNQAFTRRLTITCLFAAALGLACGHRAPAQEHVPEAGTTAAADSATSIDQWSGGPEAAAPDSIGQASDAAPGGDTAPGDAGARPCQNPRPEMVGGVATGFVACDGHTERVDRRDCPSLLPRAQVSHPPGPGVSCASDADCMARKYGYCGSFSNFVGSGWACVYGCLKDDDCEPGQVCHCGDPVGRCVGSTCTTNASCGPGLACASGSDSGCAPRFACYTSADQCRSSAACRGGSGGNGYCAITDRGRVCRPRPEDSACE